jgi:hypothetical protein
MRRFLVVSAFTASLVVITPAMSQPWPAGIGSGPPPATAYPPTAAPTTPNYGGNTAPGYQWRDQRANTDWRNNTWREQRFNEDWRNNNWRTQRLEAVGVPGAVISMLLRRSPAERGFACVSVNTTVSVPAPGVIAAVALHASLHVPEKPKVKVAACAVLAANKATTLHAKDLLNVEDDMTLSDACHFPSRF